MYAVFRKRNQASHCRLRNGIFGACRTRLQMPRRPYAASNLNQRSKATKAGKIKFVESEYRTLTLDYLGADQQFFGLHLNLW